MTHKRPEFFASLYAPEKGGKNNPESSSPIGYRGRFPFANHTNWFQSRE